MVRLVVQIEVILLRHLLCVVVRALFGAKRAKKGQKEGFTTYVLPRYFLGTPGTYLVLPRSY